MSTKIQNTKKGFTLMELLLYVGIASTMLAIISLFLFTLTESRIKNQSIAEVDQQGWQVIQSVTQSIRNAQALNEPLPGSTNDTLSIDAYSENDSPTLFYISENIVYIKEGSGAAIPLTNSQVQASNLVFSNMSHMNTPGLVRVSFTLEHINPMNRSEYEFSKIFYAAASLRQP